MAGELDARVLTDLLGIDGQVAGAGFVRAEVPIIDEESRDSETSRRKRCLQTRRTLGSGTARAPRFRIDMVNT